MMSSNPETSNPCCSSSDGCMDTQNNTNSQGGGDAAAGVNDGDTVSQQLKPTSAPPSGVWSPVIIVEKILNLKEVSRTKQTCPL